jgi:hypothetical protein
VVWLSFDPGVFSGCCGKANLETRLEDRNRTVANADTRMFMLRECSLTNRAAAGVSSKIGHFAGLHGKAVRTAATGASPPHFHSALELYCCNALAFIAI